MLKRMILEHRIVAFYEHVVDKELKLILLNEREYFIK